MFKIRKRKLIWRRKTLHGYAETASSNKVIRTDRLWEINGHAFCWIYLYLDRFLQCPAIYDNKSLKAWKNIH